MIRPLRRAHWRWMVILALTLPTLLLAFLLTRDFSPSHSVLPEELRVSPGTESSPRP